MGKIDYNAIIIMTGLKKNFIAEKIGVSVSMLSLQLKGKRKFKKDQETKLKHLLASYIKC